MIKGNVLISFIFRVKNVSNNFLIKENIGIKYRPFPDNKIRVMQ